MDVYYCVYTGQEVEWVGGCLSMSFLRTISDRVIVFELLWYTVIQSPNNIQSSTPNSLIVHVLSSPCFLHKLVRNCLPLSHFSIIMQRSLLCDDPDPHHMSQSGNSSTSSFSWLPSFALKQSHWNTITVIPLATHFQFRDNTFLGKIAGQLTQFDHSHNPPPTKTTVNSFDPLGWSF